MNAHRLIRTASGRLAAGAFALLASAVTASAQVTTQETTSLGTSTQKVTVERGEVVWASGNNVMVKAEDGALRYFPDVPDTVKVTVAGKELTARELKPGMKVERTTIVTTTPKTIRVVRSVTGTVWQVTPPNSVILTLPDRTNQRFTIPKNQQFNVDGKPVDAFGLRVGMRISASAVSERLETDTAQQVTRTGTAAPAPPPPPPPQIALLIIEAPPTPMPAAPAPAPVATGGPELPHTASSLPLVGLLGLLCCGASLLMRRVRLS